MNYVKEAQELVNGSAALSPSNFEKLIAIRDKARGREAALIHEMVERFIMKASPDVLNEIAGMIRF